MFENRRKFLVFHSTVARGSLGLGDWWEIRDGSPSAVSERNEKKANVSFPFVCPHVKKEGISPNSGMPEAAKLLSFDVYLTRYFKRSEENAVQRRRSVQLRLPTLDKSRKDKATSFRLAVPHRTHPTDISTITARGTRPESKLVFREEASQVDRQVPPPSPSDEQIEHFFNTFQPASRSVSPDGHVPYRLPALTSSLQRRHNEHF